MAHSLSIRARSRYRTRCRRQFTLDDVCMLLDGIDAAQRVRPRSVPITLSHDTYAALVQGYHLMWRALARAGLHLQRIPRASDVACGWAWWFCWQGGPCHGPFATLDAALDAAFAQMRFGVGMDGTSIAADFPAQHTIQEEN